MGETGGGRIEGPGNILLDGICSLKVHFDITHLILCILCLVYSKPLKITSPFKLPSQLILHMQISQ